MRPRPMAHATQGAQPDRTPSYWDEIVALNLSARVTAAVAATADLLAARPAGRRIAAILQLATEGVLLRGAEPHGELPGAVRADNLASSVHAALFGPEPWAPRDRGGRIGSEPEAPPDWRPPFAAGPLRVFPPSGQHPGTVSFDRDPIDSLDVPGREMVRSFHCAGLDRGTVKVVRVPGDHFYLRGSVQRDGATVEEPPVEFDVYLRLPDGVDTAGLGLPGGAPLQPAWGRVRFRWTALDELEAVVPLEPVPEDVVDVEPPPPPDA